MQQRLGSVGQAVLNPERDFGIDLSSHEAGVLECSECLDQHLVGDTTDNVAQLVVAKNVPLKGHENWQ